MTRTAKQIVSTEQNDLVAGCDFVVNGKILSDFAHRLQIDHALMHQMRCPYHFGDFGQCTLREQNARFFIQFFLVEAQIGISSGRLCQQQHNQTKVLHVVANNKWRIAAQQTKCEKNERKIKWNNMKHSLCVQRRHRHRFNGKSGERSLPIVFVDVHELWGGSSTINEERNEKR